jgi:hypothetical protein
VAFRFLDVLQAAQDAFPALEVVHTDACLEDAIFFGVGVRASLARGIRELVYSPTFDDDQHPPSVREFCRSIQYMELPSSLSAPLGRFGSTLLDFSRVRLLKV